MADSLTDHLNDSDYIAQHLSVHREDYKALTCLDEAAGWVTTNLFKRLGIHGWTQTGCSASGYGIPVRNAQHSTDGFYTIDVKILSLAIASGVTTVTILQSTPERYIRLEVEPGTLAHGVCDQAPPTVKDTIVFGGVVLIDRDHSGFYEIHPRWLWYYVP